MIEAYRGYNITYWRKPIPTAAWDYDFAHEDYDGAPDSGDHRCGNAASVEEAREMIDEQIEDEVYADGPACVENPADCGGPLEVCSDGKTRCDAHADAFEYNDWQNIIQANLRSWGR
jgi:hypothetical protein